MAVVFSKFIDRVSEKSSSSLLTIGSSCFLGALLLTQLLSEADPIGRCFLFFKQLGAHEKKLSSSESVSKGIDDYSKLHREASVNDRTSNYQALVNAYYDLATVFYEWGWGSSFHFSYRYAFETFAEAIRRHEYQLASQLRLTSSQSATISELPQVLDVGCGIGGPMRNIAKFLHCRITGITLNPYQVQRGQELTSLDKYLSSGQCHHVQGDFMKLPFEDNSFDGAYAIEATCHAPDRVQCYQQVYQKLKPGAHFCLYEWCMTDKYIPGDSEHERLKKDIEEGNGLPDIITTAQCLQALRDAGFEIIMEHDLATVKDVEPWMTPLMPSWNLFTQRFQFNWLGGHITNAAIQFMELVRIAPKGTVKTQKILQAGGFALRDAGQEGIFTTMYLLVGRKPFAAANASAGQ